MIRSLIILLFVFTWAFSFQSPSSADTIKLKTGQVYDGEITTENESRVQLKLEGTGVRLWFPRDQIDSIKRTSPQKKSDKTKPEETTSGEPLDDDVKRARELLEKMRQDEEKNVRKQGPTKSSPAPNAGAVESTSTSAVSQSEVEEQIQILRNGDFHDQLNACKKLGELGAEQAIPDLIHFLDHEKFMLRDQANKSLIKITGQNFGYDPKVARSVRLGAIERWQKWYKETKLEGTDSFFKSLW